VTFKEGNLPTVWEEVFSLRSVVKNNCHTETFISGTQTRQSNFGWIQKINYNGRYDSALR